MVRLTISLSDERHQALKEAAVRRGKTIRELIEESLDHYGIKTTQRAADYVAEARKKAQLNEAEAIALVVAETQAERRN